MALALPPPLPPQLGDVEQLRSRAGGAVVIQYQHYQLHVSGPKELTGDALAAAVSGADTLSNAVRAIASACFAAGFPAAQLVYALAGHDLFIVVTPGQVTTAAGPEYLTQYFEGMDATDPFTDRKMEPRRTLASLHADRAGDNATPLLVMQSNGTYQFDIRPDQEGTHQTFVAAEVSNPGNRFVGRHFGDVDAKQNTKWGDELHFFGRRSIDFLNQDSSGIDYTEFDLAWNRVTPFGVFGAAASNTTYHIKLSDYTVTGEPDKVNVPLKGEMTYGELDWYGLLMASFNSRWTLQARLGRTDKTLDAKDFELGRLQHEQYNWAELSTQFSYAHSLGAQKLGLQGGLAIGKGLTRNDENRVPDRYTGLPPVNLKYFVWKPSLQLQWMTPSQWSFTLAGNGQITNDNLPEQQQWVLGGVSAIAAYLPGIAVGDSGFTTRFSVEPQAFQLWQPVKVVPRAFVEYGYAKFENAPENSAQVNGGYAVADAGIDLSAAIWNWLELGLTYAEPFYDRDLGDNDLEASLARVYFRVATKFAF